MKQKLLSSAVAAALVGAVGTAQAVYNNPDGLGEVLIFPYYTVEGTLDTYVNIVNTTSAVKAVKVRFLEGMNSQEVLDFNLYLSPYDHWSGVITRGTGEAALLKTADTSCTVPAIPAAGVEFRDFQYQDDSVNGLDRTREGYVEVLEMGEVTNENSDDSDAFNPAVWATHDPAGTVPADCPSLVSAWNSGGEWNSSPGREITDPEGGLYGYGVLISPPDGTAAGFDALALDEFFGGENHTNPGSIFPSLQEAEPVSQVLDGNQVVDTVFPPPIGPGAEAGANATSSVIMHVDVINDYVLAPEINAGTDWVINFPTKRFYVNSAVYDDDGDPDPETGFAPFDENWSRRNSEACEEIEIVYYDREEQEAEVTDVDFSPAPPTEALQLCKEVNVVTFNNSNVLSASERIGANIDVDFDNGWAQMSFRTTSGTGDRRIVGLAAPSGPGENIFRGLPVIGFAVQNYVNGDLNGVLSNYSAAVDHKFTRSILNDVD